MSDFKSALLTLRDEAFFELVRNYLGPIKTPFNKHELIDRLENFLRREEIRGRIIELIDDEDAELLSAVWMLGAPDIDELYLLFAGDRSYLDLHQRLLNLEDRLLVYRDQDRLRINPILMDLLEQRVLRAERLFSSRPLRPTDRVPSPTWVTDTLLISLYAYAQERPELFRADHSLRKRARADLAARIPPLAEPIAPAPDCETDPGKKGGVHRATVLVDALVRAGALTEQDGFAPVHHTWQRLAEMTPLGRLATLTTATALSDRAQTDPVDPDNELRLAAAVEAVMTTLPQDRALSARSIERLLLVLAPESSAEVCRRTREAMTLVGLLARVEGDFVAMSPVPAPPEDRKPLVVQPNFDVTMPEEFGFDDGLFVARMATLRRYDRYPHFELTKERLAAALREGGEFDAVVERLRQLAADAVPQNVIVTMRGWASEHESIRLFRGVVLAVEPARRYAVEHAEPVRTLIRRELAPGVYLVDEQDVGSLQEALVEAGIELVPELAASTRQPTSTAESSENPAVDSARLESFRRVFSSAGSPESVPEAPAPAWLAEIRDRLEDSRLSGDQHDELTSRIQHKLIVSPDQIQAGSVKTEKVEARGLDYVGKVRIIEQAIRDGSSLLEIIERTEDGTPQRRLVEPADMSKHENELVLTGEELPDRTPVEMLVRKLGLVRHLRTGLVKRRPNRR